MDEFGLTGIIDRTTIDYPAHTYIPADIDTNESLTKMIVSYIDTTLESSEVNLYPFPEPNPTCVDHEDCHRPCHKKFLRDEGCSSTPQLQYNPENFAGLTYPFQQAP